MIALLLVFLAAPTAPLDIRADRMELTQQSGELRFEGNIVATQADFSLRCQRLLARYQKDGALASLRAEGAVRVTAEGLQASAAVATYEAKSETLVLTGDPTVKRGQDTLSGKKITFWPQAGRMVVDQARGRIQAPKLDGLKVP